MSQQTRVDLTNPEIAPQRIADGSKLVLGGLDYSIILSAPFVCCSCGLAHQFRFELERSKAGEPPVLVATVEQDDDLTDQELHLALPDAATHQ